MGPNDVWVEVDERAFLPLLLSPHNFLLYVYSMPGTRLAAGCPVKNEAVISHRQGAEATREGRS